MTQYYMPSMIENGEFAAINSKGKSVTTAFNPEKVYSINWKFGPRRGVIRDEKGNDILVVNNGKGRIFTDASSINATPAAEFAPTLFKDGDKTPRKICHENEELFMLINSDMKEVCGYTVVKLNIANLTQKNGAQAQSMHFFIIKNGVVVDALYDMKTDLKLMRCLRALGADLTEYPSQIFTKRSKVIRSTSFVVNGRSVSFKTNPDQTVDLMEGRETISKNSSWMEAICSLYQLSESKEEFESIALPIMAKTRDGLIAKTLGVSGFSVTH